MSNKTILFAAALLVGMPALAQAQTGRANMASPATWIWLVIFAVLLAIGLAMIKASRAQP